MAKKRVSLRLADNEAAVVGTIAQWNHLMMVYQCFADDSDNERDKQGWLDAASWIREWVEKANVSADEEW